MNDKQALERQLTREIDRLAGPEPHVDVRDIVDKAAEPAVHRSLSWLTGSLRLAGAAVVIGAFAVVLGLGWLGQEGQNVVQAPASSVAPVPTTTPSTSEESPVAGSWLFPDPPDCRVGLVPFDRPFVRSVEVCAGLQIEVGDDRLAGSGVVTREEWTDREAPEVWSISNEGGEWESARYHGHDRFVFRGSGGYHGLSAVLTLAPDGTLSGFVRDGELREDDE